MLAEPPEAFGRDLSTEGMSEEAAAAEEARQLDEILPDGLDTPGHRFCCVRSGDEDVGRIWFGPYPGSTSDYYLYRLNGGETRTADISEEVRAVIQAATATGSSQSGTPPT